MTRKRRSNKGLWSLFVKLITLFISIGFIGSGVLLVWIATLKIPDLSSFEARQIAESTKIYDRDGENLLYEIHENAKRTVVPLDQISRHIKNATIAIEDTEFYEHIGIKPTAILRAAMSQIIPGALKQGGSTITQQIIKNTVLNKDQTITRKLKEWILAIKLEQRFEKDEILSIYLNETSYGGNIFGVEEASKTFFGKSSKDVTLAESAYIAALPQAPSYYSPYGKNLEALSRRKDLVLNRMLEAGFIEEKERDEAMKEQVTFNPRGSRGIKAPHFSMMVRQELTEMFGEEMVLSGGLKVTTTIDYEIQDKMEKTVTKFAPELAKNFNASNTAMVAINPKNGNIVALVGSRDYFDTEIEGNFNVATALRQPGSTFKPFVYATAFKKGYTPETVLFDVKTEFSFECNPDGTPKYEKAVCYHPENYDEKFEGPITIKRALAQSRNIPAVKTLYLAGINDSIKTAEAMGIQTLDDPDRYGLTLVLGGGEVSLLDLTSAYGVFANDGIRNPYRSILKVENKEGKVLYEAKEDVGVQAIGQEEARQISNILSDKKARFESLNSVLNSIDIPVAAKTGTTNDYRDVWIIGYTPNLVVGAWAGKNDNTPMEKKVAGTIITPVWGAFMNDIENKLGSDRFIDPEPTAKDIKPVLRGIWKGGTSYFKDKITGKLATKLTPDETREEIVINNVHSILYWVEKDNPRGNIPENPKSDKQFESWEYGVRKWFDNWKKQNPSFTEDTNVVLPEEEDDLHTSDAIKNPSLKISNVSGVYNIKITADSNKKLSKAELFINNKLINSSYYYPFEFSVSKDRLIAKNKNLIKVILYDVVWNKLEIQDKIDLSI